jgi:Asp-tRNA(Asn)/Glu-tRNA(Gln) amidotransferase A subunit family amidase
MPAISVPIAMSGGLPIGPQLAGPPRGDDLVLHAARNMEVNR